MVIYLCYGTGPQVPCCEAPGCSGTLPLIWDAAWTAGRVSSLVCGHGDGGNLPTFRRGGIWDDHHHHREHLYCGFTPHGNFAYTAHDTKWQFGWECASWAYSVNYITVRSPLPCDWPIFPELLGVAVLTGAVAPHSLSNGCGMSGQCGKQSRNVWLLLTYSVSRCRVSKRRCNCTC